MSFLPGNGRQKAGEKTKKRRRRRRVLIFAAAVLLLYAGCCAAGRFRFTVTRYEISSVRSAAPVRIVSLSDLQGWTFGRDNERLLARIRELKPDLIAIAGDMLTRQDADRSREVTLSLCRELVLLAPVVYTYGNHENELAYGTDITPEFLEEQERLGRVDAEGTVLLEQIPESDEGPKAELEALGVRILNNRAVSLTVAGQPVGVAGIDNLSGTYFPYSYRMTERFLTERPGELKILLAHRPVVIREGVNLQEGLSYDLALCGHTHGGIIRLPVLGEMFRDGRIWPPFTGEESGLHKTEHGTVMTGRGLGNSNWLPRIGNIPELVVVDIRPAQITDKVKGE